jgi:drug/metabolite transporter (DMT)-like permease
MVAAMLVWPTIEGLGGRVMSAVPPLELVWLRYAVHLLLLLLFCSTGSRASLLKTQYPAVQVGRSLLMLGMPVFWLAAAARMPNASVMAIFWTTPLVGIVGASVLLRERPTTLEAVLAVAGLVGTLLVLRPTMPTELSGPLLALLMSGCYGLYLVGTCWLRREPTTVNLVYTALPVLLVLTPVMPFIWRWPPASALPFIVLIGALGLVLLFLIDRALHLASVARTAPLGFVQPVSESLVFGAVSGALATRMAGFGLLIVASVVVVCVLRGQRGSTEIPHHPA